MSFAKFVSKYYQSITKRTQEYLPFKFLKGFFRFIWAKGISFLVFYTRGVS